MVHWYLVQLWISPCIIVERCCAAVTMKRLLRLPETVWHWPIFEHHNSNSKSVGWSPKTGCINLTLDCPQCFSASSPVWSDSVSPSWSSYYQKSVFFICSSVGKWMLVPYQVRTFWRTCRTERKKQKPHHIVYLAHHIHLFGESQSYKSRFHARQPLVWGSIPQTAQS